MTGDGSGPDKRHCLDIPVREQRVDRDLVAVTTLTTPSGSPASRHRRARYPAALGSFSDGLSTTVFPAATASGTNHSGTIAGKLNGEITATTPSGSRTE